MKNKQINKFVFMFVIGLSLLFSCSNAVEIGSIPVSAISLTQWPSTYPEGTYGGYTFTQVKDIVVSYYNNDENSEVLFNTLTSSLHADGYDLVVLNSDSSNVSFFLTKHNYFDFGIAENTSDRYNSIVFSPIVDTFTKFDFIYCTGSYVYLLKTENNSSYVYKQTYRNSSSLEPVFYSNVSVKEFFLSGSQYFWDSMGYIYKSAEEPEEPDFEGITDIQKAMIINAITSSDDFSIVPNNYRNQFFIVYNTWTNRYKVYFYPEQYFLKGRIFEEGSTSDVSYKSYKIIAFEGSNFLWDLWQSISPFDYYVFSGYFNEDETFTSYFYDYKNSHEVNQYYFNYKDEPIVYTSRDIGFVIYNIDSNEYVDDTDNSISSTVLIDSDGNEIFVEIPVDNSTVSDTPWNKFITLIKNIPENIISIFTDSSGLSRIMLIATPLVEAIRLMLGVLLSSISLLSRAVTFVYILPTIEASDALFLADVDSTTGLVFTGNSWGIKFLEGLNMVKEFSWNGLNLWTLFTSFIVAMFAIHCIKLVRKHYHY